MPNDGVEVRVLGLDELVRGAEAVAEGIGKNAGPAMEQTAARVADSVRGQVPRDSGALASSVTSGSDSGQAFVGMGEGLPYAGWIEYGGTRGRPYYPTGRYVYPTAHAAEPQLVAAASKSADDEIGRYPWTRPPTN